MPSKLFQKRKEAAARRAAREAKERSDQTRILIVSEGSKTEPNYLAEFFKLDGNGRIEPYATRDHITSPTRLLNQARSILEEDGDFDLAYVVGDRDEFPDFEQARNAADQIKIVPPIRYIYSDPCFELWFLLHYELWDAPIGRHEVRKELERHIPDYGKGSTTLARLLYEKTPTACDHSSALRERMAASGATCPSTLVDVMIAEVRGLRRDDPE